MLGFGLRRCLGHQNDCTHKRNIHTLDRNKQQQTSHNVNYRKMKSNTLLVEMSVGQQQPTNYCPSLD